MKFALVDGERREPEPKLGGMCPGCGEPVTAKCGTQRVWHWAHKGRLTCDSWWEPETIWHRTWKNKFPVSWQEIALRNPETTELHIADVRTPHGLVMEFQHSAIDPAERIARENFYRNMVWIVDCTRLSSDRPRIDANMPNWQNLPEGIVQTCAVPSAFFPRRWLNSAVPVLFDFNGEPPDGNTQDHLICLMPERYGDDALYFSVSRQMLVQIGNGEATIFDWRQLHLRMIERDKQILRSFYRRGSLLSRIARR